MPSSQESYINHNYVMGKEEDKETTFSLCLSLNFHILLAQFTRFSHTKSLLYGIT